MPTLTIRVDEKTHRRLRRLAKSTDRSQAWLTAQALTTYLDLNDWQVRSIREGIGQADAGELVAHGTLRRKWEHKLADSVDGPGGS